MSRNPYMRLYPADYLGKTQHLTDAQHGAYLLLMMALWQRGGAIIGDQRTIKLVCAGQSHHWARDVLGIVLPFFYLDGVWLRHQRIDSDLAAIHALKEVPKPEPNVPGRYRLDKYFRDDLGTNSGQTRGPVGAKILKFSRV